MGQGGRIGYYITGRQSKAGGYTHDYTGIQDSQAYVGFVGIWKMCDLHLDFTSAGGGCGTVWLLGAGVCAAPPAVPRRAAQVVPAAAATVAPPTAVAGDCAPRLGTWPTLKKVGKSCQEEKGSGTPAPTTVLHGILLMTSLHSCWSRKRGGHSFSTLERKLTLIGMRQG